MTRGLDAARACLHKKKSELMRKLLPKKLRNRCHRLSANIQLSAFTLLAFATLTLSHGQQVLIAPPVVPSEPPPTDSTSDTNQIDLAGGGSPVSASSASANRNPFQWGPVILHPRLGYGFSSGTGLQSAPGQSRKSVVNTLSPGIGFDLGRHWQINYTAGAAFYSDPNFKDSVNHNLTLSGRTTYGDWGFNLAQGVAISSDPLVETAQQTAQQTYSTTLATSYQINSVLSSVLTLGQELRDLQGVPNSAGSSSDWSLSGALNYQLGPGVSTGLGAGFGYNKVEVGPDMTHEDLNLRFGYQLARQLSLSLNGGLQIRQFLNSGQSALVSPTFGASLNYRPFDYTTLSLAASRSISPSYFQNQVTEGTSVTLGLSQRFFKHYYFSVNGGYDVTTYQDSTLVGAQFHGREDSRSFFGVSLSTSFLKHGTVSVSYSKNQNSSNALGYGFNSDQFGLSLAYGY